MDCEMQVYSNDYFDVIAEKELIPEGVCTQELTFAYETVYFKRDGRRPSIDRDTYGAIPKCFTILDQSALEESGILRVQNQPVLNLKGQGVLLGFIDTGIDLQNPAFQFSDGSTRVLAVWDQTQPGGKKPEGFLYGREYTSEDINEGLRDGGELPKDGNGHGTYVAGVAAGSQDEEADFLGAAPQSAIAMVKCKEAKEYLRDFYHIPKDAVCYQENDLMAGLRYLDNLAKNEGLPLVVCLAIGSNMGNHGGRGPLPDMVSGMGTDKARCMVCGAGNEAGKRHHFSGVVEEGGAVTVEMRVESENPGFTMELWSNAPQLLAISILSPSGEMVPKGQNIIQAQQVHKFFFENTEVEIDYRTVGSPDGDQLIFINFKDPTRGLWKIYVYGIIVATGAFNIWLPMSEFLHSEIIFLKSNPEVTVTNPGNAFGAITAGAYSTENKSLYLDSGRGYNINEVVKPDFVAPGVDVYGPGIANSFTTRTGTSGAAAVSAGACALYMEWAYYKKELKNINTPQIRNVLVRGTDRPGVRIYPNREWGYGILNLYRAFELLRNPENVFL